VLLQATGTGAAVGGIEKTSPPCLLAPRLSTCARSDRLVRAAFSCGTLPAREYGYADVD
jgi:hypothetical protein